MAPNLFSSIGGKKYRVGISLVSFLVIMAFVVAACGNGGSGSQGKTDKKHVLNIGSHVGGDFTSALSPYNPTQVNEGIQGMVYETLLFFNRNDGKITPLLAADYKWSSDEKQLTFTTRQGVKWSDGQPFTAHDVAFTFNMLKQYPAADSKGIWPYLSSVNATDDNTVVVTFQKPNPPLLWYIGGQTWIVPEHIFKNVDPTKTQNQNPIGTGPFTFNKFSPQVLVYKRNPGYWDANDIKVDELDYPAVKDNATLQLKMMQGQIDWGSFFAPNLDQTFVAKDPTHNHYWMSPTDMFTLYINLTKAPFNQVEVRQAISAALDRSQLSQQAESGYVAPASTTGLILPNGNSYLDPTYQTVQAKADAAKAAQLLQSAGYSKGSDGIFAKNGKELSFSIKVVNGWTDWETMAAVIKQNLHNAGINATVDDIQDTAYFDARNNGNFDALIGGLFGGPTPFYLYDTHLNSVNLSPKGYNWGKWNDSQTDKLLQAYSSTLDPDKQKLAIQGLEKIYATQLPNIPLVNAASWYEYSTKNFTGWPDKSNPYAVGAAYAVPDDLIVIRHLTPVN
ncbi:ABC transporter substrate-binding protein [Dictyobacter arantiisoli]|uniref:Peptide ABC transporter substrate-binding protein n=1 Tax=Dictyobacter arantiisoli TaxID=2014874 RepID=A0A5A5T597_9CHLR|nr:ABC transporter substrate-binding protein [Dictyobacter arantiisoli]GCF06482.1 peptide ABC transporter substrate-binding protein [Dictyobacter arantiisoli]